MTFACVTNASVHGWSRCGSRSEIGGGGDYPTVVLASQSRDVLFQLGERRGLVRLERQSWISAGLLHFIWLGSFRAWRG